MKLQNKITIMVMSIIILVLSIVSCVAMKEISDKITKKTEAGLTYMAITLSLDPMIQNNIGEGIDKNIINSYVNNIRKETRVAFITVTDMNKIRYSHPDINKVGKPFSNNNINRAILYGEVYTDEGVGSMGITVKAFAPVKKGDKQVGVVCVGIKKGDIIEENSNFLKELIPIIIISATFGLCAAAIMAINIKKSIHGLEPKEIAILLKEREVILNSITDGLIAADINGKIIVVNDKAREILDINDDLLNENISVLDNDIYLKFKELISNKKPILNLEQSYKDRVHIVSNYSIIKEGNSTIGAFMTFKSMNEINNLIEELEIIRKLNWDLRAQNHEFINKLHTISGLIQLEKYDNAIDYIFETTNERKSIIGTLENITDVSLAGLILAKYNKATEAKIEMIIDSKSKIKKLPDNITSKQLGCIVGNLLENSIDEVKGKNNGRIYISLIQSDKLKIVVGNNGAKLSDEDKVKIFERGFSTKGEDRGIGLYNVVEIVKSVDGNIEIKSTNEETVWNIEM